MKEHVRGNDVKDLALFFASSGDPKDVLPKGLVPARSPGSSWRGISRTGPPSAHSASSSLAW